MARSIELGVVSQGKTVETAKKNLQEAMELYLEDLPRKEYFLTKELPLITSIEIARG